MEIVHRSGASHQNSDAQSCRPCEREMEEIACRQSRRTGRKKGGRTVRVMTRHQLSATAKLEERQNGFPSAKWIYRQTQSEKLKGLKYTCGSSLIYWTQEPKSRHGPQWRERTWRYNSCTLNGSITAKEWHLVHEFYGNRRPNALEAAAGSAFSKGAAAAAPACGAYDRSHGSQKDTGPGDEDGLLEGLKVRRGAVL